MTENRCVVCGRPTPDGYVCAAETAKAGGQLQQIADMIPAARDVAHGLSRHADGPGGSQKPGSRLPLDLGTTAKLDGVQTVLAGWARHQAEERGSTATHVGTDPILHAAWYLTAQLEWMRHRPEVDEFLGDVAAAARIIAGIARGPVAQRYLGPCGALLMIEGIEGPWPCDGDVYAREGVSIGRCRTCKAEVSTWERQAWLDGLVRSQAFPDTWIAEALRIPVKTIRSWATERAEIRDHRGRLARSASPAKLQPHGRDLDGRALYLLGDVADLAAESAARREEQRAKRAQKAAQAEEARAERERRVVGYMAVHQRLRRERGPASSHTCARCDRHAEDWAYDHGDPAELPGTDGPYSLDPARYLPLCRLCHKALDRGRASVAS